jgi:hypothetical protein
MAALTLSSWAALYLAATTGKAALYLIVCLYLPNLLAILARGFLPVSKITTGRESRSASKGR